MDVTLIFFASRVNAQLKSYVFWRPDPDAMAVDAFTLDWSKFRAFCFLLSIRYQGCCRRLNYVRQSVLLWCLFGQLRCGSPNC